ncbi:hypothetical protein GS4_25_00930 [Gordonia soli NBRC 108243]|uniref:Uncharacterized protein n=1 Tax=Gordonia soli NBRC 108243 TaxID=1223545 RepID=M0QMK3_9ACTN|nr:hypothetical protein GS4_25_00930 [Gordonia soli NBRC 108243]
MYIDCNSCPGRRRACDGCMMQVLFDPLNSGNDGVDARPPVAVPMVTADDEIASAIDVFSAAAMVSNATAVSARSNIGPVQRGRRGPDLSVLRAG